MGQWLNGRYEPILRVELRVQRRTKRPSGGRTSGELSARGNEWVVEIDLDQFFDGVNHDKLMGKLAKGISDKRTLKLIRSYLNSGIMEGGW